MTEENEQRMERLFHDHYEQMYRFAFALLHDNEEARDVVSDVFSRLWDKQLLPDRAYLMRSVKNACINLIARKKRDERLKRLLPLSEEKLTEEEPSRLEERWQAAVDCIDHDLTDQTASVIRLCYREGMSYKDTAEELGISVTQRGMAMTTATSELTRNLLASCQAASPIEAPITLRRAI